MQPIERLPYGPYIRRLPERSRDALRRPPLTGQDREREQRQGVGVPKRHRAIEQRVHDSPPLRACRRDEFERGERESASRRVRTTLDEL
jgi:hypothetical protein